MAAALANDRGLFTAVGAIDADKVEILEMALDRLSADDPDRALVLATLCAELTYGSPSNVARRWPTRPSPSPSPPVTTPPSCGSSTTSRSRSSCRPCSSSRWPGRPTPWCGPSGSVTRSCCSGRPGGARRLPRRAGDIDEMDRCLEIAGSLAEQLDQPTLNWVHSFTRAMRAQIAGDTDQAEQLATEALQIGTDSGQPDAAAVLRRAARWR